jgi:hypothetical protein
MGVHVRGGARWALGVGLAVAAMAVSGACAEVRSINLDECSASCIAPAIGDLTVAEDESADISLSLFGGGGTDGAKDARPDLIFDPDALPTVLVSGLPSPMASADGQDPRGRGVSPYDFFADVIDVPHSANARAFKAASFFLFTPSLTSQFSDFLWASNDFFGPPSGDIASHRAVPLSADAEALYGAMTMRNRVTPTLSPSPLSGAPSSDAAKPFGQVGDKAGRSAAFSLDGAQSNK